MRAGPIWITWLRIVDAELAEQLLGQRTGGDPGGGLAALARSSTSRASVNPYFCMPTRSAWPGRTWVSGDFVAPGAGDISSCHLSLRNHSEFLISIATGDPSVRPWRTPPTSVSSSCSKRWRGPRP